MGDLCRPLSKPDLREDMSALTNEDNCNLSQLLVHKIWSGEAPF